MKTIFISSTFQDMYRERDIILERTIPALNRRAMEFGDSVSACDLRWGIDTSNLDSNEMNQKILDVCFDEIDRCSPPMVVLLGERYGWIPPEATVEEISTQWDLRLKDLESSATALEIEYAAFRHRQRTLFYFREAKGDVPAAYGPEDELHRAKLEELKARIRRLANGRIRAYEVAYRDGQPDRGDLERFAAMVCEDVGALLEPEWEMGAGRSPIERELDSHRRFIEEKATAFRAKGHELREALDAIEAGERLLLLKGEAGVGKSTLFGKLALELESRGWDVTALSCGMTLGSSTADSLLLLLIRRLEAVTGHIAEEFGSARTDPTSSERPKGYTERLKERYEFLCSELTGKGGRHVIMIDAADQLQADEARKSLPFIPADRLGDGLRFVMTSLPELDTRSVDEEARTMEVRPLDQAGKRQVVNGVLAYHHKELPLPVIEALVEHEGNDTPLHISLMIQRLLLMNHEDYELINSLGGGIENIARHQIQIVEESQDSIEELSVALLREASRRFRPALTERVITLIGASRMGLRMSDLAALCEDDWNYLDVALMFSYLRDSFFEREDGRIDFVHRCFREGMRRYAPDDGRALHASILSMLRGLDSDDPLKRSETLYHCVGADDRRSFLAHVAECLEIGDGAVARDVAASLHDVSRTDGDWVCELVDSPEAVAWGDALPWFILRYGVGQFSPEEDDQEALLQLLVHLEGLLDGIEPACGEKDVIDLRFHLYASLTESLNSYIETTHRYPHAITKDNRYARKYYEAGRRYHQYHGLDSRALFMIYYNAALLLKTESSFEKVETALRILNECVEQCLLQSASPAEMGHFYGVMGDLQSSCGDMRGWAESFEMSLHYGRIAVEESPTPVNKLALASGWSNMGLVHEYRDEYERAIECRSNALSLYREFAEDPQFGMLSLHALRTNCSELSDECLRVFVEDAGKKDYLLKAYDFAVHGLESSRTYRRLFGEIDESNSFYKQITVIFDRLVSFDPATLESLLESFWDSVRSFIDFDEAQFRTKRDVTSEYVLLNSLGLAIATFQRYEVIPNKVNVLLERFDSDILSYYDDEIARARAKADSWWQFKFLYRKASILLLLNRDDMLPMAVSSALDATEIAFRQTCVEAGSQLADDHRRSLYESYYLLARCYTRRGEHGLAYESLREGYRICTRLPNGDSDAIIPLMQSADQCVKQLNGKRDQAGIERVLIEVLELAGLRRSYDHFGIIPNLHKFTNLYASMLLNGSKASNISLESMTRLRMFLDQDIERIDRRHTYMQTSLQTFERAYDEIERNADYRTAIELDSRYRQSQLFHIGDILTAVGTTLELVSDLLGSTGILTTTPGIPIGEEEARGYCERALSLCDWVRPFYQSQRVNEVAALANHPMPDLARQQQRIPLLEKALRTRLSELRPRDS